MSAIDMLRAFFSAMPGGALATAALFCAALALGWYFDRATLEEKARFHAGRAEKLELQVRQLAAERERAQQAMAALQQQIKEAYAQAEKARRAEKGRRAALAAAKTVPAKKGTEVLDEDTSARVLGHMGGSLAGLRAN